MPLTIAVRAVGVRLPTAGNSKRRQPSREWAIRSRRRRLHGGRVEPLRHLQQQRVHLLLKDDLHEMRIAANFGGDLARYAGWPVQHRIAHAGGKLIDAVVGARDIHQKTLLFVHGESLRLNAEGEPSQRQPP